MLDKSLYSSAPAYFHYYYDLVETNDLLSELRKNGAEVEALLKEVSDEKLYFAYAEGKWTVAEVMRHNIDTERIFAYRALRFSRFDATPLPGFDENTYIEGLKEVKFSRESLLKEAQAVRQATLCLYETMNAAMLQFKGNANGQPVTAEMLGFMIVGHTKHHLNVIRERYAIIVDPH